jgi:hypothetical protein
MSRNESTAVVARRVEPRDSLDDFPTPPWGARAWVEHVVGRAAVAGKLVWEPAVNRGFLKRGLDDYAGRVIGSDIHDYGFGYPVYDFTLPLFGDRVPVFLPHPPAWIVTNPPFKAAQTFAARAPGIATEGVALLLRTQILEGIERHEKIYAPLADRWAWSQFVERIPMVRGQIDETASSATAYGWLTIWREPQHPAPGCAWKRRRRRMGGAP